MENKIARIISYVFHPLLMPLYAFIILFNMNAYFSSVISLYGKLLILSFIFVFTFLFPSVLTYFLFKLKIISSLHLEKREERGIPYIFTIIFYYGAYYMLKKSEVPAIFLLIMLVTTMMIIIVFFINLKFKISIHNLSIGALTGLIIGISYRFNLEMIIMILLSIFISGLVGYSRITLNAHRPSEVYFGYLLGFCSMLGLFLIV